MSLEYSLIKIRDLEEMYSGNYVLIRGRVNSLYYDAVNIRAYLSVDDDSGMVLSQVQNAVSQTIFLGAVVNIRGEIALHKGKIYVKTKEISKMQTAEDGYSQFAGIPVPNESELPEFEGKRWVKPFDWKTKKLVDLYNVALQEERKLHWVGIGVIIFLLGFLMPVIIAIFMLAAGFLLMFGGVINKETRVAGYEALQPKSRTSLSQTSVNQ